ncbi:MAG: hypothetical protein CTY15_00020 [Methylocystis sp.]|nr:MAG: hypothetical protein CTY15_00020 [Methylocystis sp.]
MSMTLYLKHATQSDLARFVRDGVYDADLGVEEERHIAGESFLRLKELELIYVAGEGRAAFSPAAREMLFDHFDLMRRRGFGVKPMGSPAAPVLDLHESWHMLHFLFTGDAWEGELPVATLLAGGREVGEDLGYGRPRMLSVTETEDFARFLEPLQVASLTARLDGQAMKALGVYCVQDEESCADLRDDLARYFPRLRSFVGDAARKGRGMLIWML